MPSIGTAYVQIEPKATGIKSSLESQLTSPVGSAGKAAGGLFNSGLIGSLKKFVVPAAVVGGLVAVGKAGFDAFEEVQGGANNVIKATGATGDAAKELTDIYKDVASNVVGDFDSIGSAVGEVNTRLGLDGKDLQSASESVMKYAKVTGQDATQATKDITRLMNNAGIPASDFGNTLGKLTKAGQMAGIDVGELATTTNTYADTLKRAGLSTDEQISLMANFEKSGANTTQIMSAMKIGVSKWAKSGKDAKTEFSNFVKGVQDGSVSAGDAVEMFGSRGGLAMFEAAQKGQLSYDDMLEGIGGATSETLDTVYEDTLTASEKMSQVWNNVKLAGAELFAPIGTAIGNVLSSVIIPAVQKAFQAIKKIVETIGNIYETYIAPFVEKLKAFLEPAINEVKSTIGDAVAWIKGAFDSAMPAIQALIQRVWPSIKTIVVSAMNIIKTVVPPIWRVLKTVISTVMKAIKAVIQAVWPVIATIVTNAVNRVKTVISGISAVVSGVKATFTKIKDAIVNTVKGIVSKVKGFIDKIKSFFHFSVPTPHIPLPHFKITPEGWKVGDLLKGKIPKLGVSWYAKGGIVDGAQLIGAGEAGPEAIVPLDEFWRKIDESKIDYEKLALAMVSALEDADMVTNVNIDGQTVARATGRYMRNEIASIDRRNNRKLGMVGV